MGAAWCVQFYECKLPLGERQAPVTIVRQKKVVAFFFVCPLNPPAADVNTQMNAQIEHLAACHLL
jgi:hypothetical protein